MLLQKKAAQDSETSRRPTRVLLGFLVDGRKLEKACQPYDE